ncbi:hypothetical protein F4778DRAFT_785893 [Xylariomycetidae sp. FL2044]|nr:hypothetical protein F4778DRAFT_785893 [Xylariomycetidae sp. FL2044]
MVAAIQQRVTRDDYHAPHIGNPFQHLQPDHHQQRRLEQPEDVDEVDDVKGEIKSECKSEIKDEMKLEDAILDVKSEQAIPHYHPHYHHHHHHNDSHLYGATPFPHMPSTSQMTTPQATDIPPIPTATTAESDQNNKDDDADKDEEVLVVSATNRRGVADSKDYTAVADADIGFHGISDSGSHNQHHQQQHYEPRPPPSTLLSASHLVHTGEHSSKLVITVDLTILNRNHSG